ncbi:hypothetical protein HELRODRAFT_177512 [Helobdella robusta]|uniref:Uncharacterized protein n=1 Tax=Helobdella robusta TaxID=6412 RepID=T1FBT7_HELRO|nr:hypothetical protein HELRODRAFT_177512 [Helobdella robusta]ESN97870.1 hypothetical protein HELRODRAFT_177512 [Helobdella robusta]
MAKKIFHYLPTYAAVQFNFPSFGYFFNKLVSPNQATPLQETPHARTVDLINKPKNEPKLDIKPNTLFANVDLIKNCLEGGATLYNKSMDQGFFLVPLKYQKSFQSTNLVQRVTHTATTYCSDAFKNITSFTDADVNQGSIY